MTSRYPGRRVAHRTPPRLTDSIRGVKWAADHHYRWIDVNALPSQERTLHAQHGAPYGLAQQGFLPKGDTRRVQDLTDAELAALRSSDGYRVPIIEQIIQVCAEEQVNLELEAKDHRWFTLAETWKPVAEAALAAWGPTWQDHLNGKVLTDLSGGLDYALAVCSAMHEATVPSIILPRRAARMQRLDRPFITFNHGGRV
ncbi:hypothetical protein JCM18899A_45280 [Nocardioides sp. AN3]